MTSSRRSRNSKRRKVLISWVWGSGNLIQTLLKNASGRSDALWIYPLTIGSGKKLFADGTRAEKFKLVESKISKTGVILATYEPAGPLQPGSMMP